MLKHEVPQDKELFGDQREVCYAIDESGRYILAESAGWEPANVANIQAWEVIRSDIDMTLAKVQSGELSLLAYHMVRHQMDAKLLSGYAGLFCWQVRRHMKPGPFNRLKPAQLARYAAIFKTSTEEFLRIPETGEIGNIQNSSE